MNSVAFIPNGLRYLVLPDPIEDESETIGSVTISKKADPNKKASEGTVVAVGDGETLFSNSMQAAGLYPSRICKYKVGAKLIYGQYAGYDQEFDGVKYKVLAESEILGQRVVTPFDMPNGFQRCPRCNKTFHPYDEAEHILCSDCLRQSA